MPTFADDPNAYFRGSSRAAHHVARDEQAALQLEALQQRFERMRNRLPPLKAMADMAGLEAITSLDDAPQIMFPHSFYKSYPEYLLEQGCYSDLLAWLQRLTLNDLSPVRSRDYDTLDDWLAAIDMHTGVDIFHSSGTTGRLSFNPRGKLEVGLQRSQGRLILDEWLEPLDFAYDMPSFAVIWPSHASGRTAILRGGQLMATGVATIPGAYYPLFDTAFSSDFQYYIMRAGNAHQHNRPPPPRTAYIDAKIKEAEAQFKAHGDYVDALLGRIRAELGGQMCLLAGGPMGVYKFAGDALAWGMERALAPGSFIRCFGGFKGAGVPADMEQTLLRFTGAQRIMSSYGMTELTTGSTECRHGRYHCFPWVIPYVLDEATGVALPRSGEQRGRAAFVDLMAQTYWGGVISGDRVSLSWNACPCGRTTPHFAPELSRIPAADEDDHAIGPASPDAIHAALMALNP